MISLVFDAFFVPMLIALLIAIVTFVMGCRWLRKYLKRGSHRNDEALAVDAIAGDNIWSTKLDLARAYLETGQSDLAKAVIIEVANCSDLFHRHEANELLKVHF